MSESGWEQLKCKFFATVCRRTLGRYFQDVGFTESKETAIGGVVFRRFDCFVEISYDTNLYPKCVIKVVVGFGESAYSTAGAFNGVPMWYILPKDHPFRTKVHWTFKTEEELECVLSEVKEDFLVDAVRNLMMNKEGIERVVKSFHSEFC